jgi:hypothetical protein
MTNDGHFVEEDEDPQIPEQDPQTPGQDPQ